MRATRVSNERGVALAVAVFALVVIGALVAATFFAGRLEQQTGRNSMLAMQAAQVAEAGLGEAVAVTLNSATLNAMTIAPSASAGSASIATLAKYDGPTGSYLGASRTVKRLSDNLFLVTVLGAKTSSSGDTLARQSLAQLIRLNSANISVSAGLTAIGKVTVSGNSTVSGIDQTPSEWTAAGVSCPPTDDVAGVRYNGQVTQQGSAVIDGDPQRENDNTLTANNMLGGSSFEQLKALRTLDLTGNVSGLAAVTTGTPARCDTSVQSNWGAPTVKTSPCFTYFPIVYHMGDLSISGTGEGQGILLVEGNLQVQGRIDFYGPVIVTGGVNIRGTGSDDVKFYGGVLAQDVTLDDSKLTGNATVNYSSCAIKRALNGSAIPEAFSERSFVQLYQ
jgi:hypothetical protein